MYRGPGFGPGRSGPGRSQASATTQCQKCLKRGHYSYECKAGAQERPYKSRPSRTQQLLNPSLQPKLMTEVPEDLLPKKGLADEILAEKEDERSRQRRIKNSFRSPTRNRSRSVSSYPSDTDSVSTISTNRSRSPPRMYSRRERSPDSIHKRSPSPRRDRQELGKRRRRSLSSSESFYSDSSYDDRRAERNTRRRMSSFSPGPRGRRLSRGNHRRGASPHARHSPSISRSVSPLSSSKSRSPIRGRRARVSRSRSPIRKTRSRSPFKEERSLTPYSRRSLARSRSRSPYRGRRGSFDRGRGRHGGHGGRGNNFQNGPAPASARRAQPAQNGTAVQQQRERSLSPYSKRVALTRSMMGGGA